MPAGDDRVLAGTRVLAVVVIPALVAAVIVLLGFPSDTQHLFAWPIAGKAHMSAFALAIAYTAGLYYFVRVLFERQWHRIGAGLLAIGAFVSVEAAATIIHWNTFTHDNPVFWIWSFLYFTTPLLVPLIWWRNRTTDRGTPEERDAVVPRAARLAFLAAGLSQLAVALYLLFWPKSAIGVWPWTITQLTARSTAGWFALGFIGLMLARETRWSGTRLLVQTMLVGTAVAIFSVIRAWDELDTGRVATWLLVAAIAAGAVQLALLYVVMERRLQPST